MTLLQPGLRYGHDDGSAPARPADPAQPTAHWTLQVHQGHWVLTLSSYEPGEPTFPVGYTDKAIPAEDAAAALSWATSVLPEGIAHTITRVS